MRSYRNLIAYILLTTAPLFWAGNTVVAKAISLTGTIPPCCLAFSRWLVAFFILLPFSWKKIVKDWPLVKKSWKFMLLLSFLGFNPLPYLAIYTTTAINGALILSAMPAVVIIVSLILYKEKISILQAIGVVSCCFGAIFVVLRGRLFTIINMDFALGDLIMMLETVLYGIYSTILPKSPSIHSFSFLTLAAGIATIGTLPLCFIELMVVGELDLTPMILLSILFTALFPSIVAYLCWNTGIYIIGANRSGLFINFIPIFTSIMAIFFLGEFLETYHIVGIGLILLGIVGFNYKLIKTKGTLDNLL